MLFVYNAVIVKTIFVELTQLLGMTFTEFNIYCIPIKELCCKGEKYFNMQSIVTHNKVQKLKLRISIEA